MDSSSPPPSLSPDSHSTQDGLEAALLELLIEQDKLEQQLARVVNNSQIVQEMEAQGFRRNDIGPTIFEDIKTLGFNKTFNKYLGTRASLYVHQEEYWAISKRLDDVQTAIDGLEKEKKFMIDEGKWIPSCNSHLYYEMLDFDPVLES